MREKVKCENCKFLVRGWCKEKIYSPDPNIERDCRNFKEKTNADRIRAMTDEELAHFLTWNVPDCVNFCDDARCGCKWNCKHSDGLIIIRDWLRQPVKED